MIVHIAEHAKETLHKTINESNITHHELLWNKGLFGTKMHNTGITTAWISNAWISNAGFSFYQVFGSLFPTYLVFGLKF